MRADQFRSTNASLLKAWSPTPKLCFFRDFSRMDAKTLVPSSGTGGAGIVGRAACKDPVHIFVKDQGIMKSISSVVNPLDHLDYLWMMSRCEDPALMRTCSQYGQTWIEGMQVRHRDEGV